MANAAWLVTDSGFEKAEIVDAGPNCRRLKMLEGKRAGRELLLPPAGVPHGDFHPALYEGAEPPTIWRFNRRSLHVRDSKDFAEPEQAMALIPQAEPYTFLPHTLHVIDGIVAGDHQLRFGSTGVGKASLVLQIAARRRVRLSYPNPKRRTAPSYTRRQSGFIARWSRRSATRATVRLATRLQATLRSSRSVARHGSPDSTRNRRTQSDRTMPKSSSAISKPKPLNRRGSCHSCARKRRS